MLNTEHRRKASQNAECDRGSLTFRVCCPLIVPLLIDCSSYQTFSARLLVTESNPKRLHNLRRKKWRPIRGNRAPNLQERRLPPRPLSYLTHPSSASSTMTSMAYLSTVTRKVGVSRLYLVEAVLVSRSASAGSSVIGVPMNSKSYMPRSAATSSPDFLDVPIWNRFPVCLIITWRTSPPRPKRRRKKHGT